MMKISKEVKIGFVSLITIVLFIWLYNFLKGENLLTRSAYYYSVYDQIGGLTESNPIEVSGYKVGVVQSIDFLDDGTGRLFVTLSIDKDIKIPVGSVAEITTASLIAGMKIQFKFSNSNESYNSGDTVPGMLAESIITRLEAEIIPLKNSVAAMISDLDSLILAINLTLNEDFRNDLGTTVSNVSDATGSMARILKEREKELSETLANLHTLSEVIAKNSPNIDTIIGNFAIISDSLATADLAGTVSRLNMATLQTAILLENLNKGEGSAGKLMTDDSLYINLSATLDNLQALLADLQANPKKYINVSVFGGKNK